MSGYKHIKNQYLNPKAVELKDRGSKCQDCVKIQGYFNGMWWVCPNPQDKDRVENLHKQYMKGYYIQYRDFFLTEEDFNDQNNWNS